MEEIKTDCVQQCREEENQKEEEKVHRIGGILVVLGRKER